MADHKLTDREWEEWVDFLNLPLAQALFRAWEARSLSIKDQWANRLWGKVNPDPASTELLEARCQSKMYLHLSRLGAADTETRTMIEELFHGQHERDKPD